MHQVERLRLLCYITLVVNTDRRFEKRSTLVIIEAVLQNEAWRLSIFTHLMVANTTIITICEYLHLLGNHHHYSVSVGMYYVNEMSISKISPLHSHFSCLSLQNLPFLF